MRALLLCFLLFASVHTALSRSTRATSKESSSPEDVAREVDKEIETHKVTVFSKTYCPFSKALKALLKPYPIKDMKVVELDLEESMDDMQDHLQTLSGIHTVPQLFVNGKYVGNYEETEVKEETGELKKILRSTSAI